MSESKWCFSEPAIMPVRPGFISVEQVASLRECGVVVVECENPKELFLIRPDSMVSSKGMLYAALKALVHASDSTRAKFADEIYQQVCAAWREANTP